MRRLLGSLGALGSGWLWLALACEEQAEPNYFTNPDAAGLAGLGGQGGSGGSSSGGRGGAAGNGGSAGEAADAGVAGSSGDAGADAAVGCGADAECEDQNVCTVDRCEDGVCVGDFVAAGQPCGSNVDDQCTDPDSCDAFGVCQPRHALPSTPCGSNIDDECTDPDVCDGVGQCAPNHAAAGSPCGNTTDTDCENPDVCANGLCLANDEPNGTACTSGSCTLTVCVEGQPVGCPAEVAADAPFTTPWSSVGRPDLYVGGCDEAGTPDYALVFTAPATATFRFTVTGRVDETPYTGADQSEPFTSPPDGDAVLTVVSGSCAGGGAAQVACNDDAQEGSLDAQLDVPLTSGEVVTLYLNERTQTGGGTGTLTITQLP
jgi:hypothetical protein